MMALNVVQKSMTIVQKCLIGSKYIILSIVKVYENTLAKVV